MISFFIFLQCMLLFFMLFHDWIPIRPLNDVATLKKRDGAASLLKGSAINGGTVLIPLILTLIYVRTHGTPLFALIILVIFYSIITLGTILSCQHFIAMFEPRGVVDITFRTAMSKEKYV